MSTPMKFAPTAAADAEVQLAASAAERTQRVRTDHARTYSDVNVAADGTSVQYARTDLPGIVACPGRVRTDPASSASASTEHPLGVDGWARKAVADHLKVSLERRWANGEEWASGRSVAAKCGVDERIVRQWKTAQTAQPFDSLLVLPTSLVMDQVGFILDKRGLNNRRGLPMLREALQKLEADVAEEDRESMLDALGEASAQITARISRLARSGR